MLPRARAAAVAALLTTGVVLLSGCGGGATAEGRPTSVASQQQVSVAPPTPTPRATPSATPTENRVLVPGPPPVDYRTQQGAATLQVRTYSWQKTSQPGFAPPQQNYLVLDVQITAKEGKVLVNPLYLVAVTPDKKVLTPTLGTDGNEPVLASKELKPGEAVNGIVTFDSPQVDTVVVINDELGTKVGEIRLPPR